MTEHVEEHARRAGRNLRRAREDAGLSQERLGELAHEIGGLEHTIRRNEISRYEHGRYPALAHRIAIARALGLPISFWDREDAA